MFIIVLAMAQGASPLQPERRVEGRTISSAHDPAVKIEFGEGFRYVGGQRFILYEVADAEQHIFVDADANGRIRRLYWVQFEAYLPTNTQTYKYNSTETTTVDAFPFVVDAAPRSYANYQPRAGSDGERMASLLKAKRYQLPENALWIRLVHLPDASKRRELMIIYLEDLQPAGLAAADLAANGSAVSKWPEMRKQLLRRAESGLTLTKR